MVTSPISIGPSKDNTLYKDSTGSLSNGASQYIFVGHTNRNVKRCGVIAFDIAGNVPQGATIDSVTLTLRVSRTQASAQNVALHRLLADWGEGVSDASGTEGGGAAASSGDATWIHTSFDTATWQTPGGDFSAAPSASASVDGNGQYAWGSTDEIVADVQGWLEDPSTNFGWLIQGNEGEPRTTKRFDSKENQTAANRPSLTIEFTP